MSDNEDYILTKSKSSKVTTIEKPVKQRKPKSEAQIKQFAEMASKRMQNIAIENKQKKLAEAKRLLAEEEQKQKNQELSQPSPAAIAPPKTQPKPQPQQKKKPVYEGTTDEASTEEEIIHIKKNKKPKKKTIIIDESSSDEEEKRVVNKVVQQNADRFRSQQNKKSLVTIHNNDTINQPSRFFI